MWDHKGYFASLSHTLCPRVHISFWQATEQFYSMHSETKTDLRFIHFSVMLNVSPRLTIERFCQTFRVAEQDRKLKCLICINH